MLIRRTLHETVVYIHRVDNMAEGSAGVTWVLCASTPNDLSDGDRILYTKHVLLWQGHLADYTALGSWWVFETKSEINCGTSISLGGDQIRARWRQQYAFESRIQWKKIPKKKHWIKEATSWLAVIVHLGVGLCCATIWECAVGDKKNKRPTNGHIVYAMIHPWLYLNQIITEWGIFRRHGVLERWIFIIKSIHWCATVPTTFTVVLKRQAPNDSKSKRKTRERPPIKRWESGLLRLYIAPISANLRWYDTYTVYRRQISKHERARDQKTAVQMVGI